MYVFIYVYMLYVFMYICAYDVGTTSLSYMISTLRSLSAYICYYLNCYNDIIYNTISVRKARDDTCKLIATSNTNMSPDIYSASVCAAEVRKTRLHFMRWLCFLSLSCHSYIYIYNKHMLIYIYI